MGRARKRGGCWGTYPGFHPPPSSFTPSLSFPLGGPGWLQRTRVKAPGQFGGIQLEQVRCPVHDTRLSCPSAPLQSPAFCSNTLKPWGHHAEWEDCAQHVIRLRLGACGQSPRQQEDRQRTGPGGGSSGFQFLAPAPWLGHLPRLSVGKCGACPYLPPQE